MEEHGALTSRVETNFKKKMRRYLLFVCAVKLRTDVFHVFLFFLRWVPKECPTMSYSSIFCTGEFFKSIVQECSEKCRQRVFKKKMNRSFGVLSKSARIFIEEGFLRQVLFVLQQ